MRSRLYSAESLGSTSFASGIGEAQDDSFIPYDTGKPLEHLRIQKFQSHCASEAVSPAALSRGSLHGNDEQFEDDYER